MHARNAELVDSDSKAPLDTQMDFQPETDQDVFCWLKATLEPRCKVVAEPVAEYFAQWKFHYKVFHDSDVVAEFKGDFRQLPHGELLQKAQTLVQSLGVADTCASPPLCQDIELPFASRLPPKRQQRTWFSSGRAAFAWLVTEVVKPRVLYLPTFVCWSLVDIVQHRFPQTELRFYSVQRDLSNEFPDDADSDTAVVVIHYFGRHNNALPTNPEYSILEDRSHQLLTSHSDFNTLPVESQESKLVHVFGSLRKAYRVADGGYVEGGYAPVYEPDRHLASWLRLHSRDWRELREAENMLDRHAPISDISSQSLSVILQTDVVATGHMRQKNYAFLEAQLSVGRPLTSYSREECPLHYVCQFESQEERDSFRQFLMQHHFFTSIHWPIHESVKRMADNVDLDGAIWLESHTLAIPIAEDFDAMQLNKLCEVAQKWQSAGSRRFCSV